MTRTPCNGGNHLAQNAIALAGLPQIGAVDDGPSSFSFRIRRSCASNAWKKHPDRSKAMRSPTSRLAFGGAKST